jgi:hypothetical protein
MSRKKEFSSLSPEKLDILLKAESCGIIEEEPHGNGWFYNGRFFKTLPKDTMFLAMLEYEIEVKNGTIC